MHPPSSYFHGFTRVSSRTCPVVSAYCPFAETLSRILNFTRTTRSRVFYVPGLCALSRGPVLCSVITELAVTGFLPVPVQSAFFEDISPWRPCWRKKGSCGHHGEGHRSEPTRGLSPTQGDTKVYRKARVSCSVCLLPGVRSPAG